MSLSLPIPSFEHDCSRCRFLGTVAAPNRGSEAIADLYVCEDVGQPQGPSIIARYGNDGPEYTSVPRRFISATSDPSLLAAAAILGG